MKKRGTFPFTLGEILAFIFGFLACLQMCIRFDVNFADGTWKTANGSESSEVLETPSVYQEPIVTASIEEESSIEVKPSHEPKVFNAESAKVSAEYTPAINVSEYSDDELIAFAEKLVFRKGGWPEGYVLINDPEVSIETDDITEIAKEYATLLNLDKWTGFSTEYNGFKVGIEYGEIEIDGRLTGVKTNERIYSDIAKELYYRGVWNGKRFTLGNYEISLDEDWGYLLIEGYCSCFRQRSIDLPNNVTSYPGYYTPGKGTTVEVDGVSYTYLKGNLIKVGNHKLP